ncbi:MAG: glycosyltransferase [Methylacidiphilales bacterium]|nr:glycosyltransferase [Candidatus Methylacidiphilales bacterium]
MQNKLNRPLVSVIVPCYNSEAYLGRCLRSILQQQYQHIEVICVDDGSTDTTSTLLAQYSAQDKRISVISNEKNVGVFYSRYIGATHAKGEYLHFVDSDDEVLHFCLEEAVVCAILNDADIVHFNVELVPNDTNRLLHWFAPYLKSTKGKIFELFLSGNISHNLWNKLLSKRIVTNAISSTLYKQTSLVGIQIADDYLFLLTCMYYARTYVPLPLHLYQYHLRQASLSNKNNSYAMHGVVDKYQPAYRFLLAFCKTFNVSAERVRFFYETIPFSINHALFEMCTKLHLDNSSRPTAHDSPIASFDFSSINQSVLAYIIHALQGIEIKILMPATIDLKTKLALEDAIGAAHVSYDNAQTQSVCADQPLVSVLIPIYNVENYLAACLESVINQTYTNLEIICVDDKSTDDSLSIAKRYQQRDTRIKLICHDENKGLLASRFSGFHEAKGKYSLCVDSDDWLDLQIVELAVSRALGTNADLVHFGCIEIDESGHLSSFTWSNPKTIEASDIKQMILSGKISHTHWGKLVVTEVWKKVLADNCIQTDASISMWEDLIAYLVAMHYIKSYAPLFYRGYFRRIRSRSLTANYSQYSNKDTITNYNLLLRWVYRFALVYGYPLQKLLAYRIFKYIRKKISSSLIKDVISLQNSSDTPDDHVEIFYFGIYNTWHAKRINGKVRIDKTPAREVDSIVQLLCGANNAVPIIALVELEYADMFFSVVLHLSLFRIKSFVIVPNALVDHAIWSLLPTTIRDFFADRVITSNMNQYKIKKLLLGMADHTQSDAFKFKFQALPPFTLDAKSDLRFFSTVLTKMLALESKSKELLKAVFYKF